VSYSCLQTLQALLAIRFGFEPLNLLFSATLLPLRNDSRQLRQIRRGQRAPHQFLSSDSMISPSREHQSYVRALAAANLPQLNGYHFEEVQRRAEQQIERLEPNECEQRLKRLQQE